MRWLIFVLSLMVVPPGARAQVSSEPDFFARVRMAGFEAPVEVRRTGAKMRLDMLSGGVSQTYIADRDKGVLIHLTSAGGKRIALLFPLSREAALLPLPLDLATLEARATVRPVGSSLMAGQPCRTLEFSGYLNQSGMACANSDGILMQMTQKGRNAPLFQVVAYARGAQDAKWFVIPPDYQTAVLPGLGGATAPAGPMVNSIKP
ncbi:hypothetical protein [Asticcacaulis sp.]|uniref:hypothetical protein n=1 Tax=Asticcacaulis sp. TaxID=1872648 RepID=UPI002614FD90|nr:hypothetical protein [Asticcacaulis sp.]